MIARTDDVAARLDAWRRKGDPQCLWPDVQPNDKLAAHRRIADVTRSVLRSDRSVPQGLVVDGDAHVAAFGVAAYVSGMGPLLGHWIEIGAIEASPTIAQLMLLHLAHGRARSARFDAQLERILEACAAREVSPIVLKAAHTGRAYFPEAGARPASDIDLLARPLLFEQVRRALEAAGFRETRRTSFPERSDWELRGFEQRVHSLEIDHELNPWSVDLHTNVDRSYFRGLRAGFGDRVFDYVETRDFAAHAAGVLMQPLLTAYLALNASYGIDELRLIRIVELVLVIRRDAANGKLVWSELIDLLRSTNTLRFTYPAFALTERLARGILPQELLEALDHAATPRMRPVVQAADANGMHLPRRSLGEKLMWAHGLSELSRNVLDLFLPADDGLSLTEMRRAYVRRARRVISGQVGLRI